VNFGTWFLEEVFPKWQDTASRIYDEIQNAAGPSGYLFPKTFSQVPKHVHYWLAAGIDKHACLKLLTGFRPNFITLPKPADVTQPTSARVWAELREQDEILLRAGRITLVERQDCTVLCPRFLIKQEVPDTSQGPDSMKIKTRCIWNGRYLSQNAIRIPFKLPSARTIRGLTGLLITIDLSKAFFQLPLEYNYRQYFAFKTRQADGSYRYYVNNSLTFGYTEAPYLFQRFFWLSFGGYSTCIGHTNMAIY
jgi:hypothetical protein